MFNTLRYSNDGLVLIVCKVEIVNKYRELKLLNTHNCKHFILLIGTYILYELFKSWQENYMSCRCLNIDKDSLKMCNITLRMLNASSDVIV